MDYVPGGLNPHPQKKQTEAEKKAEAINTRADGLLKKLEASIGKPLEELDKDFLIGLLRGITRMLCEDRAFARTVVRDFCLLASINKDREIADKKRVKFRPDQVDKRDFLVAVKTNIDDYPTIAAAVRDLRIKPQFERYGDGTLRRWAKEGWPTPNESDALVPENKEK